MDDLEIRRIHEILKDSSKVEGILKNLRFMLHFLSNLSVLYAFATLAFAIAGLDAHFFFFALHLFEVIKSQKTLVNVIMSVYIPITQIIFIYIFFIVLMYFFTIFIYYFMFNYIPDGSCDSLQICLATLYTETFTVKYYFTILVYRQYRKLYG